MIRQPIFINITKLFIYIYIYEPALLTYSKTAQAIHVLWGEEKILKYHSIRQYKAK